MIFLYNLKNLYEVKKILEQNNFLHFCMGIYYDGMFYDLPNNFKYNCVKVQIKKNDKLKLLKKLGVIEKTEILQTEYEIIYIMNDYSYLFNSMNNSTQGSSNNLFNAINLSEYSSIKSGAYGKALKVYFAQDKAARTSATKTDKNDKKFTESTEVERLNEVNGNASALAGTAEKLIERGTDSLFRKKEMEVKNEDGTTAKVEDYDVDAIYNAVNDFAKKYNTLLESVKDSDSEKVLGEAKDMVRLVEDYKTSLEKVGITIGKDDELVVSEKDFKAAEVDDMKKLFNGNASFAYVLSTKASFVGATANSEANVMKTYNSLGGYENAASSMGNLMDSLI